MTYSVTYGFTADGRTYAHNQQVSQAEYKRFPHGAPVRIVYLPRDPQVSALANTVSLTGPLAAGAALVGLNVLLGVAAWRHRARQLRTRRRPKLHGNGQ